MCGTWYPCDNVAMRNVAPTEVPFPGRCLVNEELAG